MLKGHLQFIHCRLSRFGNVSFIFVSIYVITLNLHHNWLLSTFFYFDQVNLDANQSNATKPSVLWSSSPDATKYDSYFSSPEVIEFPTEHPGQNAYAYFYPPSSPIYKASLDEKPPLLLASHGLYFNYFFSPYTHTHTHILLNFYP